MFGVIKEYRKNETISYHPYKDNSTHYTDIFVFNIHNSKNKKTLNYNHSIN